MKRARAYWRIVLLLCLLPLLFSCEGRTLRDVRVHSWSLQKLSPRGFRSVETDLLLNIENPSALPLWLHSATGTVSREGRAVAEFSLAPLKLDARCTKDYPVRLTLNLCEGVGLLNVMQMARNFNSREFVVDAVVQASLSEKGKGISYPLRQRSLYEFLR